MKPTRAEQYAAEIAARVIEHWERSPTTRATFPPALNKLIHKYRTEDGRKVIAP